MEQNFAANGKHDIWRCILSQRTKNYTKIVPGGIAHRPPFFQLLQHLETLNYLLLEVINGLYLDSDKHIFALSYILISH